MQIFLLFLSTQGMSNKCVNHITLLSNWMSNGSVIGIVIFVHKQLVHTLLLTHWCQVPHIYVSPIYAIIGSDNGLSPGWRQTIIWTNAGLLSIELLGTNFGEIWIRILSSFNKMHLKLSSAKMVAIFSRGRWVKGCIYWTVSLRWRMGNLITQCYYKVDVWW